MKHNNFFANVASKALALAAVVMMSTVFTSCSKDNDDEPKPEPKAQTVTLDGEEKSIVKAEYRYHNNGNYRFHLYLSADGKERVIIDLNKDLHITGNPVDLTKKEKKRDGKFYWEVDYYKPDATSLIHTYARPGFEDPVFTTGTLTMSGSPDGTINIRLENGRVKGEDNKEHTLTVSYSGTMTERE